MVDRFITEKLHLNPRSEDELRTVLGNFEQKWEAKARRAIEDARTGRQ